MAGLTLDLINECKQSLQNSVVDYNEQFLGRFITTTREDSGIGGSYVAKMEDMAEALEGRKKKANEGFDNVITSFNEVGKTVEGFVDANLTGNLQSKVEDSIANAGQMEVVTERQTSSAPGL